MPELLLLFQWMLKSLVTAMSGDLQSLGWCCRDVRAQLNNTLNVVSYLQVQLLELMDENQQLKARLELCSEVKSLIKVRESADLLERTKTHQHIPVETLISAQDVETRREASCSPEAPALPTPPEPVSVYAQSPLNLEQPIKKEPSLGAENNVRSEPLKPRLAETRQESNTPSIPVLEGSFKCDKCSMSFPTAGLLTFHQVVHIGKGFHVCKVCNALFVTKSDLSKHLSVHPDIQQYICPVCNKSYTSKNNYKLHVKVHTGEGLYPCTFCSKAFHTENHLNVHLRTHTGERPYDCSFCPKSFTQKSGLVNHTRLHTGEKPFMCPICPKAFTQKSNLNFHLTKHHPPT